MIRIKHGAAALSSAAVFFIGRNPAGIKIEKVVDKENYFEYTIICCEGHEVPHSKCAGVVQW